MQLAPDHSRQNAVPLLHGLSGGPLPMRQRQRRLGHAGFRTRNTNVRGCGFGRRTGCFDAGAGRRWLLLGSAQTDALRAHVASSLEHVMFTCFVFGGSNAVRIAWRASA